MCFAVPSPGNLIMLLRAARITLTRDLSIQSTQSFRLSGHRPPQLPFYIQDHLPQRCLELLKRLRQVRWGRLASAQVPYRWIRTMPSESPDRLRDPDRRNMLKGRSRQKRVVAMESLCCIRFNRPKRTRFDPGAFWRRARRHARVANPRSTSDLARKSSSELGTKLQGDVQHGLVAAATHKGVIPVETEHRGAG